MKMGLRWFGEGYDTVSLEKIRQVPGVSGVITTLYGAMPGEDWEKEKVLALKPVTSTSKITSAPSVPCRSAASI